MSLPGAVEPKSIRMLALDLDGTVLDASRTPHPDTADRIREARDSGVRIVLASGRMRDSIDRIAHLLEIAPSRVCLNGAIAFDEDGERLVAQWVDDRAAEIVLTYALENRVHVSLYDEEGVIFAFDSEWGRRYASRVGGVAPRILPEDELRAMKFHKMLLADSADKIAHHRAALSPKLEAEWTHITESEPEYLEFLPAGADKGNGLSAVAKRYGIEPQEVAAIGDYLNDVEMLRFSGVSGAVGNAHPSVKALVDVVVRPNVEGGVGEFIRRFVLKR